MKTKMITVTSLLLLLIALGNHVCSADTSADMIAAINSGDAVKVAELLSGGADPNSRSSQGGMTPLMLAAHRGNAEIVNLLLEKGAKVNEKTDNGITALLLAAYNNHAEVVKLLLGKGSDANIRVERGNTAFEMAALKGHQEVANLLRARTKGAAALQIKTVVGPLEGEQKCLPVTKEPEETSQKVGCLEAGREVNTSGTSQDNNWAMIRKPVSGWVPAEKLKKTLVNQAQTKPASRRSSEILKGLLRHKKAGPARGYQIRPALAPEGGVWWRRQ